MTSPNWYRRLVCSALLWLAGGAATVVICYFWVDRPVAFLVQREEFNKIALFKWLTYPPPIVQGWAPVGLAGLILWRWRGPLNRWQLALLMACVGVILADQFRVSLGSVCGRYWPETWTHNNPSLIGTGAYGFQFYTGSEDIGSFPSGHSARIAGFAAAWLVFFRRSLPIVAALCLPMLASLVLMNYHFVGDVVAGSMLGGLVGVFAAKLAENGGLGSPPPGV